VQRDWPGQAQGIQHWRLGSDDGEATSSRTEGGRVGFADDEESVRALAYGIPSAGLTVQMQWNDRTEQHPKHVGQRRERLSHVEKHLSTKRVVDKASDILNKKRRCKANKATTTIMTQASKKSDNVLQIEAECHKKQRIAFNSIQNLAKLTKTAQATIKRCYAIVKSKIRQIEEATSIKFFAKSNERTKLAETEFYKEIEVQ
jgi:hypothetical protein